MAGRYGALSYSEVQKGLCFFFFLRSHVSSKNVLFVCFIMLLFLHARFSPCFFLRWFYLQKFNINLLLPPLLIYCLVHCLIILCFILFVFVLQVPGVFVLLSLLMFVLFFFLFLCFLQMFSLHPSVTMIILVSCQYLLIFPFISPSSVQLFAFL